jgi:hypothetical protein
MKKIIIIFSLLLNALLFSQESDGGKPSFFDYIDSNLNNTEVFYNNSYVNTSEVLNNLTIIKKSLDNDTELRNVEEYLKKYPKANYLNFYGKKIDVKKDFKTESIKFKLEDKLICLLKIKSENAYSLQILFSRFNLPQKSNFFVYNSNGMILGSFSNKNVIISDQSDNVFVTQPVEGNEVYLELDLEDENDLANVDIQINTIMHGFSNLYANDGPYSGSDATTYTSCNRNVSCSEGNLILSQSYNNTVNKGNIKSVGLIVNTNAIYGFTCSGTLINNAKQDGTPYFLTAEHCVNGSAQQPIFLNESVVIFNHETKTCTADGSTVGGGLNSPSTNSVVGMQVLVAGGIIKTGSFPDTYSTASQDFALVKLNTTPATLQKYKVCYSGWSTLQSPSNIAYSFTAHHPAGTVKKISVTNGPYITPTDFGVVYPGFSTQLPNVYYSKNYSNNLTSGYFLAAEFGDGFPYHGSSGASLFTKEGFILGTLSSGPEKQINSFIVDYLTLNIPFKACATDRSDKAKYNVLFSRFWRDYIFMQPWLNPDSQNIQSIGNYCPAGIGTWGSINVENPQEGCNTIPLIDHYAVPDNLDKTITDLNRYRVKSFSTYGKKIYVKTPINNLIGYDPMGSPSDKDEEPVMSNELICLGLDNTCQGFYLNHTYKITGSSVKKIKPKDVLMTNQLNINGDIPSITFNLLNADGNRVAILARQKKLVSNSYYNKLEIELYKYNESNNEYDTESVIDVFDDPLALAQTFPGLTDWGQIRGFYEKNTIILLIKNGSTLGMIKFYRQNENSPWTKSVFPVIYPPVAAISSIGFKTFFKNELLLINGTMGTLVFNVKPGTSDAPVLLINKGQDENLGFVNMTYQGNNLYEFFSMKEDNKIGVWRLNSSTAALINYFTIQIPYNYINNNAFVNRFYNKRLYANKNTIILPEYNGRRLLFYKDGDQWIGGGIQFTGPSKTTPAFGNPLLALNDSYFLDDLQWKINNGTGTQLYPAYNILNAEHLPRVFLGYNSGAYVVLDNLEREEWLKNEQGGIKNYDNTITPENSLKIITSDTGDGTGIPVTSGVVKMDYRNPKSYILSGFTAPLIGNKNVKLQAPHSIVIKPGFEVSSSSGAEFHAIATSIETYPESLTYDDMLHPELSDYHDKADKKMAIAKSFVKEESAIYGDLILLKDDSHTEVSKHIKIYPNPTDGLLFIDSNSKNMTFEIFNIAGQKVREGELLENKIDVRFLNKGVYLLTLKVNDKLESFKFIKK